jgi:hypothetical protein
MRELVFDVRDAASEQSVVFETLRVSVAGVTADEVLPAVVDKKTLRARLPAAPLYAVELHASGYRPLRAEVPPPEEGRPIVLRARKGWGTEVHVVDGAGNDLALVRILLDGRDAGRTGTRGTLDAESDVEPRSLRAELDGWRMSAKGDVDPETGSFRAWMPWVRVVMEEAPR